MKYLKTKNDFFLHSKFMLQIGKMMYDITKYKRFNILIKVKK